ncbi:amidohydrolase family protein [Chloroflexota bacterium]
MVTERQAWLNLTLEDPIDRDLPICDPHHHFMDRPGSRYLPEELLQDIEGHNIIKTVFIECGAAYREQGPEEMKPVGETEFVQSISAKSAAGQYGKTDIAAGIVSFAKLTLGKAVEPVLDAHVSAGKGYLKGIRVVTVWDASPEISVRRKTPRGLLLDSKFREGFACLSKYGLSFDAGVYFHQLMEVVDLARAFPDVPIIDDHTGGLVHIGPYAGKRQEVMEEWKRGITALAACPNVFIKLGGLGMPVCGFGWHEQAKPPDSVELAKVISPYFLWCIEQFGTDRCMFESNFPPDKSSYSSTVMWNAFKRICEGFSVTEREALFYDTAARVYRL